MLKNRLKQYGVESIVYIIVNLLFLVAAFVISNMVVNSYEKYRYLRIRYIVAALFLIAVLLFYIIKILKKIKLRYAKLGILSIFCIESVCMWLILISNMYFYSVDFHEFAALSIWIAIVIGLTPRIYVLTIIIYGIVWAIRKNYKSLRK